MTRVRGQHVVKTREMGPRSVRVLAGMPMATPWVSSGEASGSDLWNLLSTPVSQRRSVARDFASAMGALEGIGEVWITDLQNDLDVAIALADPELELEARNVFIDLVCERLDPSEGELFVFPDGQVPGWVSNGERLI